MTLKMSESHRAMLRSHGLVLARIALGGLSFLTGLQIIMGGMAGINMTAGMIASVGLPGSMVLALIVVAIKLLGGGALMLGYRVGLAAGSLILFTLAATFFFHTGPTEMGVFGWDMGLFKNLAIIGGLLYAMAYGPGEGWSMQK